MGKKPISPEGQLAALVKELRNDYESWQHYHDNGGSDPFYADGANMWLICNHIAYHKHEIKALCERSGLPLPEDYKRPDPPQVPQSYMARPDEIRKNARATLSRYESDPDYQYIMAEGEKADEKAKANICLHTVCGYVVGLRMAIDKDDLVTMRRHESGDRYIDSFRTCAEKLRSKLAEAVAAKPQQAALEYTQLSLFDFEKGW